MTDEEYAEAMRAVGRAAARVVDDILVELASKLETFEFKQEAPRSRSARFDALADPRTSRDWGESMTAEEFTEESRLRGAELPDWWPL